MWGANSGHDPFIGATLRGGERLGEVASDRYGILRASPYFNAADFNLIIGSQAAVPQRTQEIELNSSNHDSQALAPYFGILERWATDAEVFGPLFARAMQDTKLGGWVGAAQSYLDDLNSDTNLAIYEINTHTTGGNAPRHVRNDYVTGLGSGLALPLYMLTYQHDLGIRNQAAFATQQFSYRMDNGDYVRLWGMLRDLEATGRKRPTWLGVELANRAIRGDMLNTKVLDGNPTWIQAPHSGINDLLTVPYIHSFAFRDGDSYALVLFNLLLTQTHTVTLQLPTPVMSQAQRDILTGADLHADNEDGNNVTIQSDTLTNFSQTPTLVLGPHSMTVLRWQRRANANVTIALNMQPKSAANMGFLGNLGAFALDDPATDDGDTTMNARTFAVAPGVYTVRRSNTPSWFTMGIECSPGAQAVVNLALRSVTLTVGGGDNVTCTFTEARGVTIRARAFNDLVRNGSNLGKRNAADPWLNNWPMSVATAPTALVADGVTQPMTVANLYQANFLNLRPGSYTVCTTLPDGSWTPTMPATLDPAYGRPCKPVTLTGGQSALLLFGLYQPTAPSAVFSIADEVVTDEDEILAPDEEGEEGSPARPYALFLPLLQR